MTVAGSYRGVVCLGLGAIASYPGVAEVLDRSGVDSLDSCEPGLFPLSFVADDNNGEASSFDMIDSGGTAD